MALRASITSWLLRVTGTDTTNLLPGALLGRRGVAMPDSRSFLDNLANLHVVMSVALEHVHGNCHEFAATCPREHMSQARTLVSKIRNLAAYLGQQFKSLGSLLADQDT